MSKLYILPSVGEAGGSSGRGGGVGPRWHIISICGHTPTSDSPCVCQKKTGSLQDAATGQHVLGICQGCAYTMEFSTELSSKDSILATVEYQLCICRVYAKTLTQYVPEQWHNCQ